MNHAPSIVVPGVIVALGAIAGCAPDAPGWSTVYNDLGRAVLSVWGAAPDDVYFAGGITTQGTERRPLALHFDGHGWRYLDTTIAEGLALWAVGGTAHDDAWFVGEKGMILHWDGQAFTHHPSLTNATLFGVWAAGRGDAWAVGGTIGGVGDADVLLHFDGMKWTAVEPPQRYGATYFKVGGTGGSDVYVSGSGGLILHYDGTAWHFEKSGVTATLFSIAARDKEVLAVGGPPLILLSRDGGNWMRAAGIAGSIANAVAIGEGGSAFIVALAGAKYRRRSGTWINETASKPRVDLHAAWADGQGNAFVVGGSFAAPGMVRQFGVIGHFGAAVPANPPEGP